MKVIMNELSCFPQETAANEPKDRVIYTGSSNHCQPGQCQDGILSNKIQIQDYCDCP